MRLSSLSLRRFALVLVALPLWAGAQELNVCGPIANAYGPYDFRTDHEKLPIVVDAHFTPVVEALIRGTSGYIGGDIDYTLRAIPNHPRALLAMQRLADREKAMIPRGAKYTVDCYYDRALRFRPDDTTVRMLFASFLIQKGRAPEARRQVDHAVTLAKDNGFTHYNAGLVYLDLKDPAKALQQAHRALALGFGRTELRDALKAAGQWKEPDTAAMTAWAAEAASAAGATAAPAPASAAPAASAASR